MKFYKTTYRVGEQVLYYGGLSTVVEVKKYPQQTDLVVRMSNGKLVQVEDWKVEKR